MSGEDNNSAAAARLSRQEELDALRQRQLAKSNALDENVAVPTNMLDWAAKQRALKAADRQSKNESAEYLRSYKPKSLENSLKSMKEEDREKTRLAQEQLHNYRAKFIGGTGGTPSRQKDINTDESDNQEAKVEYSVAEAVDSLNNHEFVDLNPSVARTESETLLGSENMQAQESPSPSHSSSDGIVLVEKPEKIITESVMIDNDQHPEKSSTSDDWIDVSSPVTPVQSSITEEKCSDPEQSSVKDKECPELSDSVELIADAIDVEFTFCLLTLSEHPDISKYLLAAESIIGDPAKGPAETKSIQSVTNYSDRSGVHRHTITASICVSKQDDDNQIVKQRALGLLKQAVHDGSFKLKAIEMLS
mmetsp:Transcript_5256/g.7592  ORF Transcript_5256/g.7592 Transcript_5256/m.7592 type:complete len:363 (-) Transcript_5256:74-1162(-)